MRQLLFLSLLLCTLDLSAQTKRTYYYDENMQPTSRKAFWRDKEDRSKLHLEEDADTATFYVKVVREKRGALPLDSLRLLRNDLEVASRVAIDSTRLLVIDYYPGPDPCNESGTQDPQWIKTHHRDYQKALQQLGGVEQFYVYDRNEGLERYRKIYTWLPDLHHRVRDSFFHWHYPCGSVVVIRPDGRYIAYFGEYASEQVYGFVQALKKKK